MRVFLSLTCPEHHTNSGFPKAIRQLIYRQEHDELLTLAPGRHCSPHSGGQHRLTIHGERSDVVAWLDLLLETFGRDVEEEVKVLKRRIRVFFLHNAGNPTYDIKLSEQERLFCVDGNLVMKPWFWFPEDEK